MINYLSRKKNYAVAKLSDAASPRRIKPYSACADRSECTATWDVDRPAGTVEKPSGGDAG
jgi:hypothetical protein